MGRLRRQLVCREQPGHCRDHPVAEEGLARLVPLQVQGLHVGV
jgi:hypothetical protein